jgi:uncharacterized membrane protein YgcG
MKSIKLLLLMLVVSITTVFAQKNMPEPNPNTWVSDQANILNDEEVSQAMKSWEKQHNTGVEFAVVTVASLEDYEISDYAQKLFRKWGIGKKGSNNGILILIAPNERKARIHTGYGMEAFVTDADSRKIQSDNINKEEFKAGIYTPSVLRMISAIQAEVGTLSEAERAAWVAKQKAAEAQAEEKNWNAVKDTLWSILVWILSLGAIGGLGYGITKMVKRRRAAKKEAARLVDQTNNLYTTVNTLFAAHKSFRSVSLLIASIERIKTLSQQKFFWTSNIELNNKAVTSEYNIASKEHNKLLNNLAYRDKIDNIAERSRKTFQQNWYTEPVITKYLQLVDKIDALDLDDNLAQSYTQLNDSYNYVNELIDVKKQATSLINTIKASELTTTYRNHPEVSELLDMVEELEKAPLNDQLRNDEADLRSRASDIMSDVNHRKELMTKEVDFTKFAELAAGATAIIASMKLNDTVEASYLDAAKNSYRKFDAIRTSDSVDSNWKAMKTIWQDIQINLNKHNAEVNRIHAKQSEYQTAVKSIPSMTGTILSMINETPTRLNKQGVSSRTKSNFAQLTAKWSGLNVKTDGSVAAVMAMYATLSSLSSDFTSVLNTARREHQEHLDEIARAEQQRREAAEAESRRKQREEEEERRRSSYSSSYSGGYYGGSSGGSSWSDSGSSYGGGDSGGGGASSDW